MDTKCDDRSRIRLLILGLLGAVLLGASDWLMIYGDTAYSGSLAWLTAGTAAIPPERNALALGLSFPAVVLYCFGLFAVRFFLEGKRRKAYSALTALGLTPWLCLHLLYVMVLFLFGWMNRQGDPELALSACEAMFAQFQWVIPVAEVIMILPYLYLLILVPQGKTGLPKAAVFNNPLVLFGLLTVVKLLLPDTPWKLAFTNGLMSEAMVIWFLVYIILIARKKA